MPTYFDLTQPLRAGGPVFPGDPPIVVDPLPAAEPWHVTAVRFGSHSGTHMDAPLHRIAGGAPIDAFAPERWIGLAYSIPVPDPRPDTAFGVEVLDGLPPNLPAGWFALLATGWDRHWGDRDHFRHPYPSPELAGRLLALGAGLVGIDAPSIDSSVSGGDAAHLTLLGAGIPVVEHLRGLDRLAPWTPYHAVFAPLPLAGVDGAPVRAVVWQE